MARKVWIINLCLVVVICTLLFCLHLRKEAEIARNNETMTPEIEIPIEDDMVDEESSVQRDNTNDSANGQADEEPEIETGHDKDSDSNSKTQNSDSGSSENSDVELPVIP